MGSIIERTRSDGSKAFTAQIVVKKGGVIVHREAQTFDRKQAANACTTGAGMPTAAQSFNSDSGLLNHFCPVRQLRRNESGELSTAAAGNLRG